MSMTWRNPVALPLTLALAGSLALGTPALAMADLTIGGADSYTSQSTDGAIALLQVSADEAQTVYMRIQKGGQTIADRLAYTLGQTGEDELGVVRAYIDDFDPSATYTLSVYSTHDELEADLLYRGTIEAVSASIDGNDHVVAYATKSDGEASRQTQLPATVKVGEDSYTLVGGQYVLDADAEAVDGSVTYVDELGNTVRTDIIEGLAKGESRNVQVPQVFEAQNGKTYRTVLATGSLTASYPGNRSFVVSCREVTAGIAASKGFYTATVNLVDEAGAILATDRVSVAGNVSYTAPSTLYVGAGAQTRTYELAGDQVLNLAPDASVADAQRTFTIAYVEQDAAAQASYSIVSVAVDPEAKTRTVISNDEVVVTPADPTKTHDVAQSVDVDGVTYVPANAEASYTYQWGVMAEAQRTIYYVPADYVAEGTYQVQVAYVNIATGQTIQTKSYAVSPDMREDQQIQTAAQFVGDDGATYVRLGGQEEPVSHGYYTRYNADGPTYTVYYRDSNDDLNRDRTITRVRVTYVDRGVTTTGTTTATGTSTNGGATTAAGRGTAGANSSAGQTAATSIPQGGSVSAVSSADEGGEQTLVNGEGNDLNTQRIEDEETPLASVERTGVLNNVTVAVVAVLIAAAALLAAFFVRRNKGEK